MDYREENTDHGQSQALRYNGDKDELYYLLSMPEAAREVCAVFTQGAKKYTPFNYLKGAPASQYMNSSLRHLMAFMGGEDVDPESGNKHTAHAAWNVLMLTQVMATQAERFDDRPHKVLEQQATPQKEASSLDNLRNIAEAYRPKVDVNTERFIDLREDTSDVPICPPRSYRPQSDATRRENTYDRRSDEVVYIASPYTHHESKVMKWRFHQVNKYAAHCARLGIRVFCPISHSHPWTQYGVPQTWSFWERMDRPFLDMCDSLRVLGLPGWAKSTGVTAEVEYMQSQDKPTFWVDPLTYHISELD